ncbi:hypothetical protein FOA52_004873 [Chlamydomonas sp. UWO 241]|nr:hypothetical protein FOA52_004873 [Chlamydomonas sp. UWO 241]
MSHDPLSPSLSPSPAPSPVKLLQMAEAKLQHFQRLFAEQSERRRSRSQSPGLPPRPPAGATPREAATSSWFHQTQEAHTGGDRGGAAHAPMHAHAPMQQHAGHAPMQQHAGRARDGGHAAHLQGGNGHGTSSIGGGAPPHSLEDADLILQAKVAQATAEHLGAKVHVLQQQLAAAQRSQVVTRTEAGTRVAAAEGTAAGKDALLAQAARALAAERARCEQLADRLNETDAEAVSQQRREEGAAAELQALQERCERVERERWEAVEAMSEMAANMVLFEKEKRELGRMRAQIAEQRSEADRSREAIEASRRRAQELAIHDSLAPDEVSGLASQYAELESAMGVVGRALKGRAMFVAGLTMAGSRSVAAAAACDPGYELVGALVGQARAAREHLASAEADAVAAAAAVGGGGGSGGPGASDIVRHLRGQIRSLTRLVQHLAGDVEGDAARLLQREAAMRDLQEELVVCREAAGVLRGEAANVPQLEQQNVELRKEADGALEAARTIRARAREQLDLLSGQNRELKEQLLQKHEQLQQASKATEDAATAGEAARAEAEAVAAKARSAAKLAKQLTKRCAQLQHALVEQVKRNHELEQQLRAIDDALCATTSDAEAALVQLQDALFREARAREGAAADAQAHAAQLFAVQQEAAEQLSCVQAAYAQELGTLHGQVEALEAQQRDAAARHLLEEHERSRGAAGGAANGGGHAGGARRGRNHGGGKAESLVKEQELSAALQAVQRHAAKLADQLAHEKRRASDAERAAAALQSRRAAERAEAVAEARASAAEAAEAASVRARAEATRDGERAAAAATAGAAVQQLQARLARVNESERSACARADALARELDRATAARNEAAGSARQLSERLGEREGWLRRQAAELEALREQMAEAEQQQQAQQQQGLQALQQAQQKLAHQQAQQQQAQQAQQVQQAQQLQQAQQQQALQQAQQQLAQQQQQVQQQQVQKQQAQQLQQAQARQQQTQQQQQHYQGTSPPPQQQQQAHQQQHSQGALQRQHQQHQQAQQAQQQQQQAQQQQVQQQQQQRPGRLPPHPQYYRLLPQSTEDRDFFGDNETDGDREAIDDLGPQLLSGFYPETSTELFDGAPTPDGYSTGAEEDAYQEDHQDGGGGAWGGSPGRGADQQDGGGGAWGGSPGRGADQPYGNSSAWDGSPGCGADQQDGDGGATWGQYPDHQDAAVVLDGGVDGEEGGYAHETSHGASVGGGDGGGLAREASAVSQPESDAQLGPSSAGSQSSAGEYGGGGLSADDDGGARLLRMPLSAESPRAHHHLHHHHHHHLDNAISQQQQQQFYRGAGATVSTGDPSGATATMHPGAAGATRSSSEDGDSRSSLDGDFSFVQGRPSTAAAALQARQEVLALSGGRYGGSIGGGSDHDGDDKTEAASVGGNDAEGGDEDAGLPALHHLALPPHMRAASPRPHSAGDGPRVPQHVRHTARHYAGDEGLARPATAQPSSMRAGGGDGAPVPQEVLHRAEAHYGQEVGCLCVSALCL